MSVKWMSTSNYLVVAIDNERPINYQKNTKEYEKVMSFIKKNDKEGLANFILKPKKEIEKFSKKKLKSSAGAVEVRQMDLFLDNK